MGVLRPGLVVATLALAACYSPSFSDCQVACSPAEACPSGFDCVAGVCRDQEGACMVGPDGGLPPAAWRAVSTGRDHSCAIASDGELWCWGDGRVGQTGRAELDRLGLASDTGLAGVLQVAAGDEHTCALVGSDGTGEIRCFGNNDGGALGRGTSGGSEFVPAPVLDATGGPAWSDWRAVTAGFGFSCGLRGPSLYCWGQNFEGQLGTASGGASALPVQIPGEWATVATRGASACGIRDDGSLWCWGYNGDAGEGFLGTGSVTSVVAPPERVGVEFDWAAVARGRSHTCGLRSGGALHCWGLNFAHEVSPAESEIIGTPVATAETLSFAAMGLGEQTTCAVTTTGELYCWGVGEVGQLTTDLIPVLGLPRAIASEVAFDAVSLGRGHVCAHRTDEQVLCWGETGSGQVGDGVVAHHFEPIRVGGDDDWTAVSAGAAHTCGLRGAPRQHLECWGFHGDGRVGVGATAGALVTQPTAVVFPDAAVPSEVSAGLNHTCAVAGGSGHCWGSDGGGGRLGLGAVSADVSAPDLVNATMVGLTVGIHAGTLSSCAVAESLVYCWGRGSEGQLGNGEIGPGGDRNVAAPSIAVNAIGGSAGWLTAATGDQYGCARTTDDQIFCFGTDAAGARGTAVADEDPATVTEVLPPLGVNSWTALAVGPLHACGLGDAGQLYCWGSDDYGAAGTGGTGAIETPTPATAAGPGPFGQIAAAYFHTCAIKSGGIANIVCFGDGGFGKLGGGDENGGGAVIEQPWARVATGADHTCGIRDDGTLWCWGRGDFGQLGVGESLRVVPAAVGRP